MNAAIQKLTQEFTARINAAIDTAARERLRVALAQAMVVSGGLLPKWPLPPAATSTRARHRRKGPIQLCPVPGCSNRAAPIFSMLCKEHKDTPKRLVAKYREARRARKAR